MSIPACVVRRLTRDLENKCWMPGLPHSNHGGTTMYLQPYLFFNGRCEEAITYYQQHLGARLNALMRYKDAPPGDGPAAQANGEHVMYCNLTLGDSVLIASIRT
jgi:PhnB protein